MTISSRSDQMQATGDYVYIGFYIVVVVFNLCLVAQVLTVGLAYFYNPQWWNMHVWLVRGYSGISLILLVWVYLIPLTRRVRSLVASLPVLLALQFLTIHLKLPLPLGVLHPLIGFTLFSTSTTLVHRMSQIAFPQPQAVTSELNSNLIWTYIKVQNVLIIEQLWSGHGVWVRWVKSNG